MVCFGLICVSRLVFYERDAYRTFVSQLAVVLLVLLFADFVYLPYKVVPIFKAVKDLHFWSAWPIPRVFGLGSPDPHFAQKIA